MHLLARLTLCVTVAATMACGKPGESWAKKRFGEASAEKLRTEAGQYATLHESGMEGVQKPPGQGNPSHPYLRRPYVVFFLRGYRGHGDPILEFHPASVDQLGIEGATSEATANGIAIVEELTRCNGKINRKGACTGNNEGYVQLTLIDRAAKTATHTQSMGLEKTIVFGTLRTLPAEPS